jgi:hypothetical protein
MESIKKYYGSVKKGFIVAGASVVANCGMANCGGSDFTLRPLEEKDAGAEAAEVRDSGGVADHESSMDAINNEAEVVEPDASTDHEQSCAVQFEQVSVGGEYVDKGEQDVKMLCFTIQAACDAVLNEVSVDEKFMTSPSDGIIAQGKLWVNDQVTQQGVKPVNVGAGKNRIVFPSVDAALPEGALTKVCAGGDIKGDAGGSAKLVINTGGVKTSHGSNGAEMAGYQFTVNP